MKKIFTLVSVFFTFSAVLSAQGEMNAFDFSYNDLTGTARSVSMGGAFGALGGDASGVAINPAGIGVYKSNEIVTTLNFQNNNTSTAMFGAKTDDSKFRFSFDNLAFVGVVPINSDEVPLINFGFTYNKLKSFNSNVSMQSGRQVNSLTDYIAARANNQNDFSYITDGNGYNGDWLSILGYDGGLINKNPNGSTSFVPASNGDKAMSNLYQETRGDIISYDFNVGTTISNIISVGATISITDINYKLFSDYKESFSDGSDYFLTNWLRTDGNGWQVKTGVIFKPVNELRIGVAYHSPTWYQMTDTYDAQVDAFGNKGVSTPLDGYNDYKFRTPDKWIFSLAGVIGKYAIISADYELTNYGNMHLSNRYYGDYNYSAENSDIKADFKNASTLRVGAEVRFTPQLSGRIGYMWQESPLDKEFKQGLREVYTAGTIPQFTLVGDTNYFTWGLGYRFTPNFYTDIAFVIKNQKADLYSYSNVYNNKGETVVHSQPAELKTNQYTGLLTFGYKF